MLETSLSIGADSTRCKDAYGMTLSGGSDKRMGYVVGIRSKIRFRSNSAKADPPRWTAFQNRKLIANCKLLL